MAHMYILLTRVPDYYVGSTDDLENRLRQHMNGKVKATKSKLPLQLVYKEYFPTRGEAQKREYQIKRWKSKKMVEALIKSQTVA